MSQSKVKSVNSSFSLSKWSAVFALLAIMLSLSGCISSSKSYNAPKNIVYNGSMFNMSTVKAVNSRVEGKLPNGNVQNMKGMKKKDVEALLDQGSPIMVTTALDLDDSEMIYERRSITKYSEFSKMMSRFESAGKKVTKFMANKKATQLKLK